MTADPNDLPDTVPRVRDEELRTLTDRLHRQRWWTMGAVVFLVICGLIFLSYALFRDEHRLSASCSFYKDIATANVIPPAPPHKPSQLGVQIVADSRLAYEGENCGADLPPPSPALVHWAQVYHVHMG
jgi:hypothetical protein